MLAEVSADSWLSETPRIVFCAKQPKLCSSLPLCSQGLLAGMSESGFCKHSLSHRGGDGVGWWCLSTLKPRVQHSSEVWGSSVLVAGLSQQGMVFLPPSAPCWQLPEALTAVLLNPSEFRPASSGLGNPSVHSFPLLIFPFSNIKPSHRGGSLSPLL